MRQIPHLLLTLSLTLGVACSASDPEPAAEPAPMEGNSQAAPNNASTPEPEPPRMIQPGEATVELGQMRFSVALDGNPDCGDPCEVVYDMCRAVGPFPDSFAILETTVEVQAGPAVGCEDPYRGPHGIIGFKTLAVVAGREVPEKLTVIAYTWERESVQGPPTPGDTYLLPLYAVGDEWFAGAALDVQLGVDATQVDPPPGDSGGAVRVALPETFEGLVQEAERVFMDPAVCGPRSWTSNEHFEESLTTPGDPQCGFVE